MIITKELDEVLFRILTDRNLLNQYDLIETTVRVALKSGQPYKIDKDIICELNRTAVRYLCESAGFYRQQQVWIKNSEHVPPPHAEVPGLMEQFLSALAANWGSDPVELAAYTLWRLCWIHPFAEGNGRTARAVSYLVLCLNYGVWFHGSQTLPKQIRDNRDLYYKALREADAAWKAGKLDVSAVKTYLAGLLTKQLSGG